MANQYDSTGKYFEAKAVSRGEFEALKRFPEYEPLSDGTLMRIDGSKEFRIYPENVAGGFPFTDDARLVERAPGSLQTQNAAKGESRFLSSRRSRRVRKARALVCANRLRLFTSPSKATNASAPSPV